MKIIFATQNLNKYKEARQILPANIELLNLRELDYPDELPETGNTFEANALQKARHVNEKFGMNCFADDSGLVVPALNGEPGVYSARYAGHNADNSDNIAKLLLNLRNVQKREAEFVTCIALILSGKEYLFEGKISGRIIDQPRGNSGFGYDPVFIPDGFDKTFAEMTSSEKNKLSHRAIALQKMTEFLQS